MKVKVRSPDGDTDFFDIVACVLQGDTLAPYLFIIRPDYVLQTLIDLMKENGLTLEKARSRRYYARLITDANYSENIVLPANTPSQAESLLHSLEWVAGDIGLHVNADKTEYSSDTSMLNSGSLKLVNKSSEIASHQPKMTSIRNKRRHGQLSRGYWSYESLIYPIKQNAIFSKQ